MQIPIQMTWGEGARLAYLCPPLGTLLLLTAHGLH